MLWMLEWNEGLRIMYLFLVQKEMECTSNAWRGPAWSRSRYLMFCLALAQ
jgi:hypothetical protein